MSLTLESLSAFGTYGFKTMTMNDLSFIQSPVYENPIDRFKLMCKSILNGKGSIVNQLEFDGLLYKLMKNEPDKINEAVFEIVSNITVDFRNWISQKINDKSFTLDTFQEGYINFYKLKQNLCRQLRYFENCITKKDSKYSHIMLMLNYSFYKNVIDQVYNYNGKECYLHTILGSIINDRNVTIDRILPVFQMFKFYEKLSFAAGKRREELFNVKGHQEFLVGLGSNVGFVKSLIKYIDSGFAQLLLCADDADKTRKLKSLKDVVRMGIQFHEREMFIQFYRKSLESRLFNTVADLTVERDVLTLLKENKDDSRTVQKMFSMIKDIQDCREHKKMIERLDIKVRPDTIKKYMNAGLDATNYDQRVITVIPLAYGVWDLTLVENNGNFNVPLESQIYLDIFNKYFTTRFSHRKINYNFNNGTAVINIILDGIKYRIVVTTPQLFVLQQFNLTPKISANDLAMKSGMSLKQLTPILNSLLSCTLIDREKGDPTDSTLKFFINTNFKCSQKEFSIVPSASASTNNKNDDDVLDQFAHKREDIVKCLIVKTLKHNNGMPADVLYNMCTSSMKLFELTPQLFKTGLYNAIKENYVEQKTKEDGLSKTYNYVDREDSDNDDDFNEDEEDN